MEYIDLIITKYGWEGITLTIVTLLFFFIQLYYYLGYYGVISKYRDKNRPELHNETPKVSVLVPLFTDDYPFLDERLPMIMAQEGVDFEVVLIYIGTNNDFYDDLLRLQQVLPNVVITKIQSNPRFPISIKTALNVGIKAANYEHMIFTTADCYPLSDRWLSLMANGFKRGDLVLGYGGYEPNKGAAHYFMRASRMMSAANWLSRAVKGRPYRGHRTNIGWTKSLYFGSRGFSHLNMNVGEDDLFIQRLLSNIPTPAVSVILSPRATVNQVSWGEFGWWSEQYRYYRSSFSFYKFGAKSFERWEVRSRMLFALASFLMIVLLPLELKIASIVLILTRIAVVSITVKNIAKRLGEQDMVWKYGLYDTLSPLYTTFIDIWLHLRRDPKVWR